MDLNSYLFVSQYMVPKNQNCNDKCHENDNKIIQNKYDFEPAPQKYKIGLNPHPLTNNKQNLQPVLLFNQK